MFSAEFIDGSSVGGDGVFGQMEDFGGSSSISGGRGIIAGMLVDEFGSSIDSIDQNVPSFERRGVFVEVVRGWGPELEEGVAEVGRTGYSVR